MATKAPLGQMIVELGLDSTDFGKGLQSSKREVRTWSNEMSASMRAADLAGNKIGKLQARQEGLTKIISAQQKQVDSLKKSYDNSFVDGKPTAQTEKLASQLKKAEANLITYQSELRTTAGELAKMRVQTEGFTGWLNNTGKGLQKFGKGATTLGNTLTKYLTVPLTAGVTLATKAAMDWETAFAGVVKTSDELVDVNGNVVYSYQDLEDGLRSLAKELPATHTEIAAVGEAAGQLGIQTDNITSFTKTMIDLGESTNMSAETAATSLARLANITGMSQAEFDRLGSSIVDLGNNFATTEAEITDMALRLAGAGNQIGMTEADILGLAAAMSSVGINAEAGGTAMSTVLKRMQNAVADGSDDLVRFAKVARMSASEFADAFEKDPARALQAFVEGLELSSGEGENLNAVLGDLGIKGIREADTLLRLAGNSQLLGNALDRSATAWDENTALAEEAQQRYDTLESQLGMLRNEAVDVAITFGGPFVSAFKEALETARPFIGSMADLAQSFADADPKTQQMILKMIGFGIAVGPVIRTVGGLSTTIGKASVKTVEFLSELAKKKAMADFGTAAATASGTKGIGAMTGALSTLNPWLIGLVGAGGLLLAGYGAWKIWGEEAYEAGQRTKRWGTDVGEATDEVLTDIQEATGQFGLMRQGFHEDSVGMIGDFTSIGETIESDLNRRLELTEEYLGSLPKVLKNSQEEILQDYQDQLNEALNITQENTAKIQEIQKTAVDENGNITKAGLDYIRELQNESLSQYITTLNLSAEEEKNIRQALTGDITQTTKEQGVQMLALLSQQEKTMGETRRQAVEETKQFLKENNISPESKMGQELLSDVNRYYDALSGSGQRTMHELVQLYPELINEIDLQTGKMLNRQQRDYDERVEMNKVLMETWEKSHRDMSKAVEKADKASSYIVENSKAGAKEWNDIVVASGDNVDEFRKQLIEATKDSQTWNDIRLRVHDADLDSNAKLIIGEAAIANGWWDGMAWEDKQAILKDNFSEVVYKAIVDEGTWDKLSWEEQIAVLNNEFSDTIVQAIMDEGKWKKLPWEQKQAILTTNSPDTLRQILKDFGVWNKLSPKTQKLLADGSQVSRAVSNAQRKINSLRGKSVTLQTVHESVYTTVKRAGNSASSQKFAQSGGHFLNNERGTNNHPGGPAIVNDQKGPLFRELIQHPDGTSYIPFGRNVLLDLPRGAKVLRASLTKQRFPDIPQYATGIGNIPVESTVIQNITKLEIQ